jgi:GT2 family glycosyltransferase
MNFDKISVGIKTILRDAKLFHVIDSLRTFYPGIHLIVADDGQPSEEKLRLYKSLTEEGHFLEIMSFDSGFGAKSNRIAQALQRPYLLVASDDFDFSDLQTRDGVQKLAEVLDDFPNLDIASGRVNNNPYEFDFEQQDNGSVIIEHAAKSTSPAYMYGYVACDLTVNYSLIRKEVFEKVHWDEDQFIGNGEHGAFFLDAARTGFKVGYVPGVNINTLKSPDSEEYRKLRNRARSPERSCFVKRGIKRYVLGNGQVDYDVISNRN